VRIQLNIDAAAIPRRRDEARFLEAWWRIAEPCVATAFASASPT